jgi:hypothetical protein
MIDEVTVTVEERYRERVLYPRLARRGEAKRALDGERHYTQASVSSDTGRTLVARLFARHPARRRRISLSHEAPANRQ